VILHLEDNLQDADLVQAALRAEGIPCEFVRVADRTAFLAALERPDLDLILADYTLPDFDGLAALELAGQRRPGVAFILLTGTLAEEIGLKALRDGAMDFVSKDKLTRLGPSVRRVARELAERRERERAEAARGDAELRLREVWENCPDGLRLTDETGRIVAANPAFCQLAGRERAEVEGRLFTSLEASSRSATEFLQKHYQWFHTWTVEPVMEQQLTFRSGRTVEVEVSNSLVRFQGQPPLLLSVFRDITERKRVERECLRLAAFPQLSPCPVLEFARDGALTYFNDAALALAQELGEKSPLRLLPPDTPRIVQECLAGNEPKLELETTFGSRTLTWFFNPIPASQVVHCYARDVTSYKQAEAQIREQAALLDKARDAITVMDLNQRITYWNQSAERLYGYSTQEASGQDETQLLFRCPNAGQQEAYRTVLEKGEWTGELCQVTKAGKEVIVESRWTLVRDDQGQPKAILVISSDVTERVKLQAQFLRAQRLESIGTLASGIAHDLNNILAPIMMSVNLLQDSIKDAPNAELLETLRCSAQRGAELIKQILSFTRGQEGARSLLNLKHPVTEFARIARETFPKNIQIKTSFAKDLWPISADATQMHQVLMNLCVNARDAMPNGGTLRVEVENRMLDDAYCALHLDAKPGPYVALFVADSGTSIAPAILHKIFDPFFTTKQPGTGTGLGLSTTLAIVKAHGGFINTYSEPGKGTRFQVFLPAAATVGKSSVTEHFTALPSGRGERILLVDDERAVQEITKAILKKYGYKVLTAGDGTEALALYAVHQSEIDLVMTDIMMPFMDGQAAIRALQKINPAAKIIAISGLADNEVVAQNFPTVSFLLKPFTPERLLAAVDRALHARPSAAAA
jgi:hypothetical protein